MKLDRRNETLELLPWYENGTLAADEHDAVRDLLASDLEANRQVRELRALRAALADEPILATNMSMNLRRLYARIDPPQRARPAWFAPFALAATAVLVVLGGIAVFNAGERAGRYRTLTDTPALAAAPAASVLFRVDVAPGLGAVELAQLAGDGTLVLQGPSQYGVATLAVPGARADAVLARLKADQRLRFVAAVPQ